MLGRHSPTVPDCCRSPWIARLWISRAVLEKGRQHLTDQHSISPSWLKARHKRPSWLHVSLFRAGLEDKGFGRAGFTLVVKGLKKKKSPPPKEENFTN